MKKALLVLAGTFAIAAADAQVANHVVISEVYGGGGNSGATWQNDFIELYNPTASPVSLAGWSVQYASATGTSWQVTNLTGSIPAYGFYLVQEAQGAGGTTSLPTPNATGTIAMSGTNGKVALVNTTTALSGACPTGATIVDFVGFGSANCFEGTAGTAVLSNTTSAERKASSTSTSATLSTGGSEETAGNAWDSDNNSADFVVHTSINPQNSSILEGGSGTVTTASVAAGNNPSEPSTNGTFTITLSDPAPVGGVTITYTLSGTADSSVDYTDPQAGTVTIAAGNTSATVNINTTDDVAAEAAETIILTLQTVDAGYTISGSSATITLADDDVSITAIHTIQGSGATAASGNFTVEGIVTGVYSTLSPAGFYMQEEDADMDANNMTAEGIFIVSSATVAVGDKVKVSGSSSENSSSPSFGQAVMSSATVTVVSSNNAMPSVTNINLPVSAVADYEWYEGMLVQFPGTLTVTDNFNLGKFGELNLSANGIVYTPTQIVDLNDSPASGNTSTGNTNGAAVTALTLANAARTILLDDGRGTIPTLPYVNADNTLRIGSTTENLTGIMGYGFSNYRIQPLFSAMPTFTYASRPSVPTVGANANVKVASFNVLNYFNGDGMGGGFPTARGAHSAAEFTRQRDKIINAISQLDADVVGLIEIENDGTGANSAIQDLVNGLNAVMGAGTYALVNDGASIQPNNTDAIRCGIIYKPAAVSATGAAMISMGTVFNRPPLAQTFTLNSNGEKFNFIINHFKSKGCTSSTGADVDLGDGQSCYNATRKAQATGLINFINNDVIPTSGTDRILTVGDYNAYYEEDPMDILRAANYSVLSSASSYSYLFFGQVGSLDHAVASSSLAGNVTGVAKWNINSAEPTHLGYDDNINDGSGDVLNPWASTYTVSPFRSSDHDPVLIGLELATPNDAPAFTSTAPALDTFCMNASAYINDLLEVTDADTAQTLTWYVASNASHGLLVGFPYTQTTNGGNSTPMGIYYSPFNTYTGQDTFTVAVTDGMDTTTRTVYVTVRPQLNPTASIATQSTSVCPGLPVNFTANGTNIGTNPAYIWTRNGDTLNNFTAALSVDSVQHGDIFKAFIVVDSAQLGQCAVMDIASAQVTMSLKPRLLTKLVLTNGTMITKCQGDSVKLELKSTTNTTGLTLQWELGGNDIAGATNNFHYATVGGIYTLTAANSAGCENESKQHTFVAKPKPVAVINLGGAPEICEGSLVQLSAQTGTGYSYTWRKDGVSAGSGANLKAKLAGIYSLVVKQNGCISDTAYQTITTLPLPTATITAPSGGFCNPGSLTMDANTGTDYTYQWIKQSTPVGGATAASYTTTTAGSYYVTVTDSNGCSKKSAPFKVTAYAVPAAAITATGSLNITNTGAVVLKAGPAPTGAVPTLYQWYKNGVAVVDSTDQFFTANENGSYTVEVTKNGCANMSNAKIVTGGNSASKSLAVTNIATEKMLVYPNPSADGVFNISAQTPVNVMVKDIQGKLVYRAENTNRVDLSQVATGMYLLQITDAQGNLLQLEKLIKQ